MCRREYCIFYNVKAIHAAPRKHGRGTRGATPASDAVARASDCVCVFFVFLDSRRLGSIRAESGRIGHIGSYWPAADTVETIQKTVKTCRKRPKLALNMAGKAETCFLLSFLVNQGIVCVF